MTVSTFYFDGSTSTTDNSAVWTNDSNAFDGNTATYAETASTGSGNWLEAIGTNATGLTGTILAVQARVYFDDSGGGTGVPVITVGDGTNSTAYMTATGIATGTANPSAWFTLSTPSTGWTQALIQGLQFRLYILSIGTLGRYYQAEVRVYSTTSAYIFPQMVGSSANVPAFNSYRFLAIQSTSNTAWTATQTNMNAISASASLLNNYKINLGVAPASGKSRTFTFPNNSTSTNITTTISDTATSGSDTTHYDSVAPADLVVMKTVGTGTPTASAPNQYRINTISENQTFLASTGATTSASALRYLGIQQNGVSTGTGGSTQPVVGSGNFQNFYVQLQNTIASGYYRVTLVKNGVDTAITFDLNSTTVFSDTSTTISYTDGDTFYWRIDPTVSAPSAAAAIAFGIENDATTAGTFMLISGNNTNFGTSGTKYNNWYGDGPWTATETDTQALAYSCSITKIYAVLSAAPGAAKSRDITFRKNTADTTATVNISGAGTTTGTWTGSVSVATDDLINVSSTANSTPTNATVKYALLFQADAVPSTSTTAPQMLTMGVG